jgi:hypothetical protein
VKPHHKWIAAIVGLLAANVIAMVLLVVVANGSDSSQVLPEYKGYTEKK